MTQFGFKVDVVRPGFLRGILDGARSGHSWTRKISYRGTSNMLFTCSTVVIVLHQIRSDQRRSATLTEMCGVPVTDDV